MVADRLGLRLVNYTFRNLAKEHDMSFEELQKSAETDSKWDRYLDKKQLELAREGDCVLGSRLAVWLLEEADLSVYLTASLEVRARRIREREGGTFEEVFEETTVRDQRDRERYLKLYSIDNNDYGFVDLVIDTENMEPHEVASTIVDRARSLTAG